MILNEFIKETQKNQMISTLLKHYNVGNVKMKMKSMKDHAHFNVDTGTLELSSRYKNIKDSQIKEFLITIIHEINHAIHAKNMSLKGFDDAYNAESDLLESNNKKGSSNPTATIKYRYFLIDHIMGQSSKPKNIGTPVINEYSKQDKDLRLLSYKIFSGCKSP